MSIRAFSYGGGVQSTAALVLAARGEIDFPDFVFANVGDDSEHPKTLVYVEQVAKPYAAAHGITVVQVGREGRRGAPKTLYRLLTTASSASVDIPVRMSGSGAVGRRGCTGNFKIRPIASWLKRRGASDAIPGVLGLGISLDEYERMRSESGYAHYALEYPLIDRRLNRAACQRIITAAGLPTPTKSACWFCPFHRRADWLRMRREEPALFARAADLERTLNDRRARLGKDPVWFTDRLQPLEVAIGDQMTLDEAMGDACESGFCEVS